MAIPDTAKLIVDQGHDCALIRLDRVYPMWREDSIRRVANPMRDSSNPMMEVPSAQALLLAANLVHSATPELGNTLSDHWGWCSDAASEVAARALGDQTSPLCQAIWAGVKLSKAEGHEVAVDFPHVELGAWMRAQPEYAAAPRANTQAPARPKP